MKIGRWGVPLVAFALVCVIGVPAAQAVPTNVRRAALADAHPEVRCAAVRACATTRS